MANLVSPLYPKDALRLSACYDILSAFIMYLVRGIDEDPDITEHSAPNDLTPDLLLKLRRDLSETFSLTLEFFRDRWDATVSGAGELDPDARTDPNAPLPLTWDNPSIPPTEDPIIISGLRALSLWIREDDNSQLHKETIGVTDMLVSLYSSSITPDSRTDFRHPILLLLSGLLPLSDEAVQLFLDQNGWSILSSDLKQCFVLFQQDEVRPLPALTQDLIRVLIAIVESDAVPQSREAWMDIVKLAAKLNIPSMRDKARLEILAGVWQLVVEIVSKAPKRLRAVVRGDAKVIQKKSEAILKQTREGLDDSTQESLIEVVESLRSLV